MTDLNNPEISHRDLLNAMLARIDAQEERTAEKFKALNTVVDDRFRAGVTRMNAMEHAIDANAERANRALTLIEGMRREGRQAERETQEEVKLLSKTVSENLGAANAVKWIGGVVAGLLALIFTYFQTFGRGGG